MAALLPHLQGADRVREVFRRERIGDLSVADLYAPDGVIVTGRGRIEGRAAIREFYRNVIETYHSQPEVKVVLEAPGSPYYAAILETPTDRGSAHGLDLFRLDDEGIRQLEILPRHVGDGPVD